MRLNKRNHRGDGRSLRDALVRLPARARRQVRQGGDGGRVRRQRGDGRTIEDAMNAPEAPTEAPRPHSVRMDGHESAPN